MTRIIGTLVHATPCCGALYASPKYASMNFSAFEYWTDGWREHSLMPNDDGLRRCKCGQFVLMQQLVEIDSGEFSGLPYLAPVPPHQLADCFETTHDEATEVAARLGYWRHLNHDYRGRYRQHRDAEETAIQAAWELANPDRRNWWDKLRGKSAPSYLRPSDSPFTFPVFAATGEQTKNMNLLSTILQGWVGTARSGYYAVELAELYRQQGRFEEAFKAIQSIDAAVIGVGGELIFQMIKEGQAAPMRYMA